MAVLAVQSTGDGGITPLVAASAGGDSYQNTGQERLIVENLSAGALHVKVLGGVQACSFGVAGTPGHDVEYSIPAGVRWTFKPFRPERFNDANGRVQLTYADGVAGPLNVGVFV